MEVMTVALRKSHDTGRAEPVLATFDRLFDWPAMIPTFFNRRWMPEEVIRVDEYQENGTLVVKAELPGIDPEKDVELTVADGMLHIAAERREEEQTEEKGFVRKELRYGSFARTLRLPAGVSEEDFVASYKDGILEVQVPAPTPKPTTKVPIAKS